MSYAYQLGPISQSDFNDLQWLAARGYDGNAMEAWDVNECVNDDPHAFLTCCGSEALKDAFVSFLDKIV